MKNNKFVNELLELDITNNVNYESIKENFYFKSNKGIKKIVNKIHNKIKNEVILPKKEKILSKKNFHKYSKSNTSIIKNKININNNQIRNYKKNNSNIFIQDTKKNSNLKIKKENKNSNVIQKFNNIVLDKSINNNFEKKIKMKKSKILIKKVLKIKNNESENCINNNKLKNFSYRKYYKNNILKNKNESINLNNTKRIPKITNLKIKIKDTDLYKNCKDDKLKQLLRLLDKNKIN